MENVERRWRTLGEDDERGKMLEMKGVGEVVDDRKLGLKWGKREGRRENDEREWRTMTEDDKRGELTER